MKKKSASKLLRGMAILMAAIPTISLTSCSSDDNDVANDKSEVAITGSAYETGATFAKIYGYANIERLPNSVKVRTIGIQTSDNENMDSPDYETTEELGSDNRFEVAFESLTPQETYFFRTYVYGDDGVYRYGDTKSFTTGEFTNIVSKCDIQELNKTEASFKLTLDLNALPDRNKGLEVNVSYGIYYSESRDNVTSIDSIEKYGVANVSERMTYNDDTKWDDAKDTLNLVIDELKEGTTYYYCTFTYVNGKFVIGSIDNFNTLTDTPSPDPGTEEGIIADIDEEDNVNYTSDNATAWGNYMRAAGTLLVQDATTLYNDWTKSYYGGSSYATQFKKHQIAWLDNGLSCLVQIIDGMADIANEVGESKIGEPLALYTTNWMSKEDMRAGLYAVESWYSWHSRQDYSNNILSIRNAYYGVYDKSTTNMSITPAEHSMYNTVQSLNPSLNTQMVNAINGAINAILAIPQPFRNHINTTETRTARQACATLESLLSGNLKSFFKTNDDVKTDAVCDPIVANIVDNVILPTSKNLMDLNNIMQNLIISFQSRPSTSGFAALGGAWINAHACYSKLQAFLWGPASDDGLDPNMDSWPLDRDAIVNLLASQRWNEMQWSGPFEEDDAHIKKAQALRGFHTLEFLIFKNGMTRTVK